MSYRSTTAARTAAAIISVLVLLVGGLPAPAGVPHAAAAAASQLKRYPYLTDLVAQNVTVNWATDRSQSTGSVKYGVAPNCTTTTLAAVRTSITVGSVNEYQWKANISGLSADTQYCYRVYLGTTDLLATDASPTFRRQVAAGSGTPFSFAVFGDWGAVDGGGNNPDQANVMQQIAGSGVALRGDHRRHRLSVGGTQTNYGDLYQKGADDERHLRPRLLDGARPQHSAVQHLGQPRLQQRGPAPTGRRTARARPRAAATRWTPTAARTRRAVPATRAPGTPSMPAPRASTC